MASTFRRLDQAEVKAISLELTESFVVTTKSCALCIFSWAFPLYCAFQLTYSMMMDVIFKD